MRANLIGDMLRDAFTQQPVSLAESHVGEVGEHAGPVE
jgi:hypothetical protein